MKKILVIFLACMLFPVVALCSTTKILDQDADLHPQGWTSGTLKFKQGSSVEFNEQGEVISGVLKYNEVLHSLGRGRFFGYPLGSHITSNYLNFKADSGITFDEHGLVISGTLTDDTYLYLIYMSEPEVKFQGGTTILFDKNGNVSKGVLNKDALLRPAGSKIFSPNNAGFLTFKAGTEVVFGPDARVIKGTIANDITVKGITYLAGTTLQFNESGYPQKI
ncbi:hypothetical protein [Anaeroselena agilis]|uniref:Uncharacterized protein n=1 Tax=Anaeroselena agilis TaxID=3063788 RepID=A0ABU3NXS8_9FIRM|nr:hypothetical protein [Selenomonadales bacterium 4137-cl]